MHSELMLGGAMPASGDAASGVAPTPDAAPAPDGASAGIALITSMPSGALSLLGQLGEGMPLAPPFSQSICLSEDMLVAGTTHAKEIEEVVDDLQEGARLRFERAVGNPHDKWAVEVFDSQGRRMGFLPADSNEMIARLMDAGKCIYGKHAYASKRGAWNRIHMEVYLDD